MSFSDFKKYMNNGYHLPQLIGEMTENQMEVFDYADELHALFCEGKHDEPEATCDWDFEEESNNFSPWILPSHNKWFNIAEKFISLNIDPDMAWDAFTEVYGYIL